MTAGRISAYTVFALVVFIIGFRVSFPVSVLTDRIQEQASKAGIRLSIGDVSLSGLIGLSLKDIKIGPKQGNFRMKIDELDSSVGLFSLITGKPHLVLQANSGNGTIGPIDIIKSSKSILVKVGKINNFPLQKLPVKIGKLSAVIKSGKGHFRYDLRRGLYQSKGELDMELKNVGLLKPSVKIPGFGEFKLTSIALGKLNVRVEVGRRTEIKTLHKYRGMRSTERVINLGRLIVDGRDIKLLASPSSTITIPRSGNLMNGQLNLEIAFHIMNRFFDKKVKKNNKLEQPNKGLRTLLSLDAKWKRTWYKGFYGLICTGAMRRPHCFPKKTNQKISYFHLSRKETVPPKAGSLFGGGSGKPKTIDSPTPKWHKKKLTGFEHKKPKINNWRTTPKPRPTPSGTQRNTRPSRFVETQAIKSTGQMIKMAPIKRQIHMDLAKPALKPLKKLPKQDDDEESGP